MDSALQKMSYLHLSLLFLPFFPTIHVVLLFFRLTNTRFLCDIYHYGLQRHRYSHFFLQELFFSFAKIQRCRATYFRLFFGICYLLFCSKKICFCSSISWRSCSFVGRQVRYLAWNNCSLSWRTLYRAISSLVSEQSNKPMVGLSPSVRINWSYILTYISICPTS